MDKQHKRPVFDRFHINYDDVVQSQAWFKEKVDKIKRSNRATPGQLLSKDGLLNLKNNVVPGNLYFFQYDPKLKEVLPYYDTFPMVFIYKPAPGGFLGLNLHCLEYPMRFALFKKLVEINNSKFSPQSKIKFTWGMVDSMAKLGPAKHCIKHYLTEHVYSPYMKVDPKDWVTALHLPVERFIGASKQYVWQQAH
jgi:hypothetical protein